MRAEAVCFDLDDTLYDYREYARTGLRAAADLLEARTGEAHHDELLGLYFDEDVTEGTFDRLVARHDLDPDLVPELVSAYHDATAPIEPYAETEGVLSRLTAGYDLGLVTDGRGGRAKLRRLDLAEYFDAVVVTPELGCSKREREAFDRALALLDGEPTATVYVGDDPRVDFRVPNRLGMHTVRLRRGRHVALDPDGDGAAPDAEIDALEELPALVE